MATEDDLRAENDRLRAEVEAHRQREIEDLRSQLAAAREAIQQANAAAADYRAQAYQQADLGRQIDAAHQATISRLKDELATARQVRGIRAEP